MKRLFLATLLSAFASLAAFALDMENLGPKIGTTIPHDLSLNDSDGMPQSFNSLKKEKGAVLVFYRSAKWCPYCQKQLISIETIRDQIAAKGYEVIGISYDEQQTLTKFKKRRHINFPLLSDTNSEVIDAFGIRNEKHKEGHYAYGVPHPLIAFVDADGFIKAKLYEESYKNRPELEAILETLDTL